MLFNIIILLLVGLIAFFHYLQGMFSATLSAIIAIIAATLAISYQETLVESLLKGKIPDVANAIMICVLFAAIYIILRTIFDKMVPGNLRFPAIVDKIGAGVMGVIVGLYSAGVFAIAAQTLPLGPSIAGYSRYDLRGPQSVVIPGRQQMQDSVVYDQISDDKLDPQKEKGLFLPVDDIVMGTVAHFSDGGVLAGERTLASVHPDYLQELFGDRIGIQTGAKRTAIGPTGQDVVSLGGVFSVPALRAADGDLKELHGTRPPTPSPVRPAPDQVLLVVRIEIKSDAADDADHLFRFSPGSIRLVAGNKDYYPIGTVDNASVLMVQLPDDYMFLDMSSSPQLAIDAAFLVDKTDLFGDSHTADKIADGRFVEIKRQGRIDLSGKVPNPDYTQAPEVNVLRKPLVKTRLNEAPPAAIPAAPAAKAANSAARKRPAAAPVAPSAVAPSAAPSVAPGASAAGGGNASVSAQLTNKIGVNTSDGEAQNVAVAGGTVSLKDSRLAVVKIDPTATLEKLAAGDSQLNELYVPDGKKLVQIVGSGASATGAKLVDATGNSLSPNGYVAVTSGGLSMRYDFEHEADLSAAPASAPSVIYLFVVPSGTQLKQFTLGGHSTALNLAVP